MKKTKWFIYSLIVGFIPFLARLCIFIVMSNKDVYFLFNSIDFIILGLVLNITNINELESKECDDIKWKSRSIGLSTIFIILYAVFLAISAFSELSPNLFDTNSLLFCTIIFSLTSVLFGYSIFNRISNVEGELC